MRTKKANNSNGPRDGGGDIKPEDPNDPHPMIPWCDVSLRPLCGRGARLKGLTLSPPG